MIQLNPEALRTEPENGDGNRPGGPLIPVRFLRPFGGVKGQIMLLFGLSDSENVKFDGFDFTTNFPVVFIHTSIISLFTIGGGKIQL